MKKLTLGFLSTICILISTSIQPTFAMNLFPQLLICTYKHGDANAEKAVYATKAVYGFTCPPPTEPEEDHITVDFYPVDSTGLRWKGNTKDNKDCHVVMTIHQGQVQ